MRLAGFAIVDSVFSNVELSEIEECIAAAADSRTRAGARHLLRLSGILATANDYRLLQIAAEFIGASPIPFKATLFDKSPKSNWLVPWHQDTAVPVAWREERDGWGPWSTKDGVLYAHAPAEVLQHIVALRIHLDDSTRENGPLRVLPGTHRSGRLTGDEIAGLSKNVPPVECVCRAGSVVAMRPLLVHASSKSTSPAPRRVIHIEYASGDIDPLVDIAPERRAAPLTSSETRAARSRT
jgi:ectoine hydroxylase-related dioxygenase (phytanoyl-CoA dioxygenase family)